MHAGRCQVATLSSCARAIPTQNGIMRKRIVASHSPAETQSDQGWLNLEQIATVEVSSELPAFPIESAFSADDQLHWRASEPGTQQIRVIFDEPICVHRIRLRFDEREHNRTQETTLRWESAEGGPMHEIVRQQWNFSPTGSTTEIEDYAVNLDAVSVLELTIEPDLTRTDAIASLTTWRIA